MSRKKLKKPNPHRRHIVLTFKVNAAEMQEILAKAIAYENGNVSAHVRKASLKFKK